MILHEHPCLSVLIILEFSFVLIIQVPQIQTYLKRRGHYQNGFASLPRQVAGC